MNPVDHPHGGGEGKNKGSHPVTPWGKPTLGLPHPQQEEGFQQGHRASAQERQG